MSQFMEIIRSEKMYWNWHLLRKQDIEPYTLCIGNNTFWHKNGINTLWKKRSMEIQRFDLNYTFWIAFFFNISEVSNELMTEMNFPPYFQLESMYNSILIKMAIPRYDLLPVNSIFENIYCELKKKMYTITKFWNKEHAII